MAKINKHFAELANDYLFSRIAQKVGAFQEANPDKDVIKLGIGDVTLPIAPAIVQAMEKAAEEMASGETFKGYGPEQGYEFLRSAISENDYKKLGIDIDADEIFVSDGSKCDVANIQELFDVDCKIAIGNPVYPVYRDSNILAGRGANIIYMDCIEENNFEPVLPDVPVDIVYLCSPNNPTGGVMSHEKLKEFVDYAKKNNAIILYDCAYFAYIKEDGVPRSIYEVEGAKEVAIEMRSYSKTAGFTGVRCAYSVLPKALPDNLNQMWRRRQSTKFNGVAYVIQRAAEAIYLPEGKSQIQEQIDYYMGNAQIIRNGLTEMGYVVYGGDNSPYIWWKIPAIYTSEEFFDALLENCAVVGTPGSGFGSCGEGFFRLTAFGNRMRTQEALERIRKWKTS